MKKILPGIYHWTRPHPEIGIEVSSYFLEPERVLFDPLIPPEGFEWFNNGREPRQIILTNRLHVRDSGRFVKKFRCPVYAHTSGLHDLDGIDPVKTFNFGDTLPGNVEVIEVNAICPDESALFIDRENGILAFADAVIRDGDGPLGFVDDELMAGTPKEAHRVKAGLKKAFQRIVQNYEFDHILLAHGNPWIGNGKDALKRFIG